MKKLLFIYNPKAGKSKVRGILADLVEIFDRAGYVTTLRPTRRKGDTARLLNRHAEDYDRIVISGGDGTLNEALSGIRQAADKGKKTPELGYIPTGSTNDFAQSIGLPTDPVRAAKVAVTGDAAPFDAGCFNGHPFAYVAAFGAFTKVSYATPQQTKNSLGHFAYVLEGIKSLPQIRGIPFKVETENETFEGNYLYGMVSNTNCVGGFCGIYGKENTFLNDGYLEVLLIKEPRTIAEQSELMSDLLRVNLNSRHITALKAKKITFTTDREIPWTLDGEFGGSPSVAQIAAIPSAFRVATTPELPEK